MSSATNPHWPGGGVNNGYDTPMHSALPIRAQPREVPVLIEDGKVVIGDLPPLKGWPAGSFQAVFADIFQEAFDLLVKKQVSYGPANVEQLGFFGVFSRLASDKVERLRNLLNGRVEKGRVVIDFADGPLEDETLEDTLLDLINYGAILVALKRGLWGKPLA